MGGEGKSRESTLNQPLGYAFLSSAWTWINVLLVAEMVHLKCEGSRKPQCAGWVSLLNVA